MSARYSIEQVEAAGGYNIIYGDPNWHYRQRGRGAAANHYHTTKTSDNKTMQVERIAAKNAVLFMWGTWPNLFECEPLINAWGFKYVTLGFLWVKCEKSGKIFWGGGSYSRSNSEFCLLAKRGKMSAISHGVHQLVEEWQDREDLVLRAPIGEHSEKPAAVRDRIVELFGDLPRIELFSRHRVPGWDCHGDQVPGGADIEIRPQGGDSAGEGLDAGPQQQEREESNSQAVHVYVNQIYSNNTNDRSQEVTQLQGDEDMGQMPQSVRERIAKSRATMGGNNIRHGEYILMFGKNSYERMNSGNCHINEFIVVQSKKIIVMEGDVQKEYEPNAIGTQVGHVINYDGKGKLSADGNSKAIVLGFFGLEENVDDAQQQADLSQALADMTSDAQPCRGMLIKLTTYAKEVRSRPGSFITGMKWSCVDRLGQGENTVEKANERWQQYQQMLAQQAKQQGSQQQGTQQQMTA